MFEYCHPSPGANSGAWPRSKATSSSGVQTRSGSAKSCSWNPVPGRVYGAMPDVISASWRSVAVSPLGMPGTYLPIGSSRESLPSSNSCRITVAVMVLVRLPTRVRSLGVGTVSMPWPAVPDVPIHVPCGDHTPATTPGKPPSARTSSSTCWKRAPVAASTPVPVPVVDGVDAVAVGAAEAAVASSPSPEPHAAAKSRRGATSTAAVAARRRRPLGIARWWFWWCMCGSFLCWRGEM